MANMQLTLSKTKNTVISTYKKVEEKLGLLFIVVVIIPTLCSIIYFGFWASDVYISESQFVIRTAQNPTNPAIGDYTIASSLTTSAVLQDSAAIAGYLTSMDGLKDVNNEIDLIKLFTDPKIDIFNRFASLYWNKSMERLLIYFNSRITVDVDPISYVTTLTVKTFTPQSAEKINKILLLSGEKIVNQINERTKNDLISLTEKNISDSKDKMLKAQQNLATARNTSSQEINKDLVSKIQVLSIERDTAERQLSIALDAYSQALMDVQHKSIYLETTSKPNRPDYPMEPKRILSVITVFLLGLMCFGIFKIVIASIKEHHD